MWSSILATYSKFSALFGLTPLYLEGYNRFKYLNYYPLLLLLLLDSFLLYIFCMSTVYYADDINVTSTTLYVTYFAEAMLLNVSFLCTYKVSTWKEFLRLLQKAEEKTKIEKAMNNYIALVFLWTLFLLPILIIISGFVFIVTTKGDAIRITTFILTAVIVTYKSLTLLLVIISLNALECCYRNLCEKISTFVCISGCTLTGNDIENICTIYLHLFRTVKMFNHVFGWILFCLMQSTVVMILMCIEDLFHLTKFYNYTWGKIMLGSFIGFITFILILTLRIVIPADAIERSGRLLDETCHEIIMNSSTKSPLRKELLVLSRSVKMLAPKISAAGFYNINRRILLGLASVITTYFIVYLQFK